MTNYDHMNQQVKRQCPECKRWFSPQGLNGHLRFVHGRRLPVKQVDPTTGKPLLSKPRPTLLAFNADEYLPAPPPPEIGNPGIQICDLFSFNSPSHGDCGMRWADYMKLKDEGALDETTQGPNIHPTILQKLIKRGIIKKQE